MVDITMLIYPLKKIKNYDVITNFFSLLLFYPRLERVRGTLVISFCSCLGFSPFCLSKRKKC